MKNSFPVLAAVCVYFFASADLFAAFSYVNNNSTTTIVPYGGTYTYSVTWTGGDVSGVRIVYLHLPKGQTTLQLYYGSSDTYYYDINGVASSDVGSYSLSIMTNSGSGNTILTKSVSLYVSPAILTQPNNTICLNGASTTMGISAGPSTATFQWFDAGTGSSINNAGNSPAFTPTSANNGEKIYCKIYNNYGSVNSTSAIVTVGSTPVITTQPLSVGTNCGSPVTFTVTASGTQPLYYQWYKNGVSMQSANLNYITFQSVTNTDNGTYQVAITNSYGSTNSASVRLTVANPVVVTSQPSSLIVTQGQTATFNVIATGDSLTYQWRLNNNAISGATNNFYTITNTPFSANGRLYSVVVANLISSFTSSNASLTVVGLPIITVQPSNKIAGVGSNATLSVSVTAGASPIFYQWFNTNNAISNQTNSLLTLQNLQLTDSGGYYVVITNSFGSVTSSLATLTVQLYAPIITVQPIGGNVVVGSNFTFVVSASGTTPNYQWQNDIGYIAGANENSLTLSNLSVSDSGNYSVVITNSVGSVTSSVAILNVGYPPAIFQQPVSITANYGGNASLSCIVTGTVPISLQWLENGTALSGQTNSILTLSNIQSAMTGFQLTATNAFGSTISSNASITNITFSSFPSNLLQGLVAYYPFIGNANDASGNGFNATNNGGVALVSDRFGNANSAYSFDGSTGFMTINDPTGALNFDARSNNYTVSLWFSLITTNNDQKFITDRYNNSPCSYDIYYRGDLNCFKNDIWDGGSGGRSLTSLNGTSPGIWHQLAVVVTNGFCQLFLDGIENSGGGTNLIQNSGTTKNTDGKRLIGADQDFATMLNGIEGDIRIYNRALSSNEVSQLYSLESGNLPPQNLSANIIQNNAFQLEFFGTPNYSYILQAATNLTPPINWQSIITNNTDANGFWNFADTNTVLHPTRFYRAMVP